MPQALEHVEATSDRIVRLIAATTGDCASAPFRFSATLQAKDVELDLGAATFVCGRAGRATCSTVPTEAECRDSRPGERP